MQNKECDQTIQFLHPAFLNYPSLQILCTCLPGARSLFFNKLFTIDPLWYCVDEDRTAYQGVHDNLIPQSPTLLNQKHLVWIRQGVLIQ